MDTNPNQPGLNISFNPMSSGSIAATNSSGYTAVNSEDTDPELTYSSSLIPQSYEGGSNLKSYQFHNNSPTALTQNRIWNSRSNNTNSPGLKPSPSMINGMVHSPRNDNQGIHLPSFMSNSLFDTAGSRQNTQGQTAPSGQYSHLDYSTMSSMKSPIKEPIPTHSSSQYSSYGQNVPSSIMASYQRKKQMSLNQGSSGYNSNMTSVSSFENRTGSSDTKGSTQGVMEKMTKSFSSPTQVENSDSETIEMLKSELSFKNQVNEALKEKLNSLKIDEDMSANLEDETRANDPIRMPTNYVQLFRDLTKTLEERTQELKETKAKIEAIIVGTIMTKDSSVDYYETFDAQDIAHRITNKLSVLQAENEALLSMVSYSNKQSLLIELGLLKNENKSLREKLENLRPEN